MKTKIDGNDLLELGFPKGPKFGTTLIQAQKDLESGLSWDKIQSDIRREIYEIKINTPVLLQARKVPLPITIAADPQGQLEEENVNDALTKMKELSTCPIISAATLMPDTCVAGSEYGCIPVGGAIVTENQIIPNAHSSDVHCSMQATFFQSDQTLATLLDQLEKSTLFGPFGHLPQNQVTSHPVLETDVWKNPFLKGFEDIAKKYLRTQGDGNHFASIAEMTVTASLIKTLEKEGHYDQARGLAQVDPGTIIKVLVTHHGSRNLGAKVFKRGIEAAIEYTASVADRIPKTAAWLDLDTPEGKNYWEALDYLADWTKANHGVIAQSFLEKINSKELTSMSNAHNHIWKHENKVYHGKGATPAWKDKQGRKTIGIIPLNMGSDILVVLGSDNPTFLSFAPHGAGRNQSRTDMLKPFLDPKTGKKDPKKIEEELAKTTSGLDIRWGSKKPDLSESPIGYKSPESIKAALQKYNLAEVITTLSPKGCIMAGEFEPLWMKKKKAKKFAKSSMDI